MKLNLNIGGKVVTATLADNATARDFVSVLPLSVSMNDLFGREKYGDLPRALSEMVLERAGTKLEILLTGLRIISLPFTTTRTESRYPLQASSRSRGSRVA